MCTGPVVVVLGQHGVDVVASAAVMGDVREVPIDQSLVAWIEGELGRAGGSDSLRQRMRRPSRLADCVRYDTRGSVRERGSPLRRSTSRRRAPARRAPKSSSSARPTRSYLGQSARKVRELCKGQRVSFSALAVTAELAEGRLERPGGAAEPAAVALQPGQLAARDTRSGSRCSRDRAGSWASS